MKLFFTSLIVVLSVGLVNAQTAPKRKIPAKRTTASPKIDGILDDAVWNDAPIATDFIELRPVPGRIEDKTGRTEVKLLYDDYAIYISARMYDKPDSVVHELVERDQIGNADFVGVVFDTFLDGVNGYGFFVTAAGVQFDAKYSLIGNEDETWNAVWECAVKIDDKGWTAEMKIPYSALRFSSKELQDWGFNITRKRTRINRQTFWNYVDPKVNGFINQSGIIEGFKNIKAPLRLSFSPYVSALVSNYPYNAPGVKNTQTSINGGMDVKYGITKSFTLDMTLIPDFGQVQSDYRVLNLTPFEVKFNENRQFFTEGTELFNKGDLFYSKRIGSIPSYFNRSSLKAGDKVIKDPQEGKVLNATKISGRTANGLGIGIFNAVTNKMYTEVEDASGNRSRFESQPLTNYNIIVLDQSLKNNSSVSFINTNVLRQGSAYDANVSAALFNINDKKNEYYIEGAGKMSYLTQDPIAENRRGYSYGLEFGKKSGSFTMSYEQELSDTNYDPSDMGFYTNNNFFNQGINLGYNVFEPGKWYNQIQAWTEFGYSRRFRPGDFQSFSISPGISIGFKNLWSIDIVGDYNANGNDFYEARNGQRYQTPENIHFGVFVNGNRAKAYNYGGNFQLTQYHLFNSREYNYFFYQNLRVNDRLAFGLDLSYHPTFNAANWVGFNGTRPIFSRYDRNTVENSIDAKYSFSNKMGLKIRLRHYWSDRRNKEFFNLTTNGTLTPITGAFTTSDQNYNVFNIDFSYVWQFTPGSELNITYKNAAEANEKVLTKGYTNNFNKVLSGPQNNSLSIKVLYYIDYLNLVKKHKFSN